MNDAKATKKHIPGIIVSRPGISGLSWEIRTGIIAVVAVMAVVAYLAYISHKSHKETYVLQTQQQLLMTAGLIARCIEGFIDKHSEVLKTIVWYPLLQEDVYRKVLQSKPDSEYCLIKSFYEIHKEDVDALATLDADGIMLHRRPFIANRLGMSHTDKSGVAYVLRERKSYVSEVFYNNLGNPAISISELVFYKGEFAGIVRWMIQANTI